jgi:diguanylate cyclase (GGDEF)-like protein/PAS domain S-box-containing protein
MQPWVWGFFALVILAAYQQFRIYTIRRAARKHEELFQIVTENAGDMIAVVDMKGRRLYSSPAYRKVLGYSSAEMEGTLSFQQIHPDDRFRVLKAARETRATGIGKRLEYRMRHKDGSWRMLESLASAIRDDRGQVVKLVIVNRDITERSRAEEQLEHNLFHDPLTGLRNRRLFLDRLQYSFARQQQRARHGQVVPSALLLANLDNFKSLNETAGAAGGDEALVEISRRIESCLAQEDPLTGPASRMASAEAQLFRLGNDEFTILLEGVYEASDAMRLARRIQVAVAEPLSAGSGQVRNSLSIGIAVSTPVHERPEEMLKDADAAMRRAKALGKARCEIFDEALHTRAVSRMRLEEELQAAFAENQFRVHYQPTVQLDTGRIVNLEARLRWEHPTQGLLSPAQFLEVAEDTGILVSIGHWMLSQAARDLRAWDLDHAAGQPLSIAVKVSSRQFAEARLGSEIQSALRLADIEASRLQIELTENVAAADPDLTLSVLSQLKHLGVGIILDDFGVGSSSLRGLWQFPVDALKIDRLLVHEMQADRATADMIQLIITLAHQMNLRVIAEGIETARQAERLHELGCEFGQGYYFSKPVEANAVPGLLRQHREGVMARGASAG